MLGCDFLLGLFIEGWMCDVGFINIVVKIYKVLIGLWVKDKCFKDIGFCNFV